MWKPIPLMRQPYIYTGEDTPLHKKGETYHVIETGFHWIKAYGFCIWMTTEKDKATKDPDIGMSMSPRYFHRHFWQH